MTSTATRPRRPLIVQVLMPLRMWALLAFTLAAWPIVLPLLWLGLIGWLAWLTITSATARARSATATMAAAGRATAPAPRRPANAIRPTAGLKRR
jgi:hypothetical protein